MDLQDFMIMVLLGKCSYILDMHGVFCVCVCVCHLARVIYSYNSLNSLFLLVSVHAAWS